VRVVGGQLSRERRQRRLARRTRRASPCRRRPAATSPATRDNAWHGS
jgi:hypothetical protein